MPETPQEALDAWEEWRKLEKREAPEETIQAHLARIDAMALKHAGSLLIDAWALRRLEERMDRVITLVRQVAEHPLTAHQAHAVAQILGCHPDDLYHI